MGENLVKIQCRTWGKTWGCLVWSGWLVLVWLGLVCLSKDGGEQR